MSENVRAGVVEPGSSRSAAHADHNRSPTRVFTRFAVAAVLAGIGAATRHTRRQFDAFSEVRFDDSCHFISASIRPWNDWVMTVQLPQSSCPLAAWLASKNVLGNLPSRQILNEPKSLYQAPSGASGFDSLHSFS